MNSESTKYAGLARVKSSFGVSAKELHAKIQADFGKSESASGRQNEFSIAASRSSNDPEHCAWRNPIEVDLEAPAHSVTDIWPNSSSPDAVPVRATWTRVAQKRAMGDKS
ncbi:hypothetical protein H632_c307p2 [Helicosporidium sp. ATCC 50920]|nr:hypothetical protein H632_c307p2 [Helicosporidium sp. ATCC 50920]|eukprot:KDD76230.1 hypothetical protein H632_c307p2 [Helicosporidium sp. ATCC 50920]